MPHEEHGHTGTSEWDLMGAMWQLKRNLIPIIEVIAHLSGVIVWNQNFVESFLRKLASRMSTLKNSHHVTEGVGGNSHHLSVPTLSYCCWGTSQEVAT